jgi:transposase
LEEHCATWAQTQGVQVSVPTMWRAIARVGWTPKKTTTAKLA